MWEFHHPGDDGPTMRFIFWIRGQMDKILTAISDKSSFFWSIFPFKKRMYSI